MTTAGLSLVSRWVNWMNSSANASLSGRLTTSTPTENYCVYMDRSQIVPIMHDANLSALENYVLARDDRNLRQYWKYGPGALKIAWGTPGDLTRCHRNLMKYVGDEDAWGLCQKYHIELFGRPNPESGRGGRG